MTSKSDLSDLILTVNVGSSSVKLGLFELTLPSITPVVELEQQAVATSAAFAWIQHWLARRPRRYLRAIGHRIVHGGNKHWRPTAVTPGLLEDLRQVATIDPEHMPSTLEWIALARSTFPAVLQFACFDTAFHRSMPRVAKLYPLPGRFTKQGIIRYGFHGLSCEHIVNQLTAEDPAAALGRIVIAHLGNGASMTAVLRGRSIETTMGFSPTSGLMMGTRCGDLDPMLLLHLILRCRMRPSAVARLVGLRSGLLGVSGISQDVRILLSRMKADRRAQEALDLFCHTARKYLGALCAVLGGVDTLVFTGGIGEHVAVIRQRLCAGLENLGIVLDGSRNRRSADVISADGAGAIVRVMHSDENKAIARHVLQLLRQDASTAR